MRTCQILPHYVNNVQLAPGKDDHIFNGLKFLQQIVSFLFLQMTFIYEWLYSYPTIDQISFLRFLPCFLYWLDTDLTNVGTQLVKFDLVLVAKNKKGFSFLLMIIVLLVFLNIHTQNISLSYDVHNFLN